MTTESGLRLGQRVEVDARGSIYDRASGKITDVDDAGIIEVELDRIGPAGEYRNLFTAGELVPEGQGRPRDWRERLGQWWRSLS